jgi:hypothetical protein
VMPDSLQGIEFRRVGWEVENLDVLAMVGEPSPNIAIFVIGGVVLDEENLLRKIAMHDLFEIGDIDPGIEYFLEAIEEACPVKLDGPEYFERVSLAGGGNLRLDSYGSPGLVERWVLPEAGLVSEKNGRPLLLGFFLRSGNRRRVPRDCKSGSALANCLFGR